MESFFRFTIPHFRDRQKESRLTIPNFEESSQHYDQRRRAAPGPRETVDLVGRFQLNPYNCGRARRGRGRKFTIGFKFSGGDRADSIYHVSIVWTVVWSKALEEVEMSHHWTFP